MRRTSTLALATTAALLLTACTGPADTGTPAPDGTGSRASTAAAATPATPAPVDEELSPATEECLLGTWDLDLAAMRDDLVALVAAGEDAVTVEVAGTTTYEFAAGGRFSATVDSSSSVTMTGDDSELTSSATSTGELTGAWSLDGGTLVVSDLDTDDLTVETSATMDGEELDVPDGTPEDAIEVLPPTSSTASCAARTLTLATTLQQDEDAEPVTLTYTLRR